jgi:hypothetical protein
MVNKTLTSLATVLRNKFHISAIFLPVEPKRTLSEGTIIMSQPFHPRTGALCSEQITGNDLDAGQHE